MQSRIWEVITPYMGVTFAQNFCKFQSSWIILWPFHFFTDCSISFMGFKSYSYLPPIWKSAEVVPVPKVHPPTSICNDLRLISLLPTIAKVFESIVGKWFLTFIEPHLDNCQFRCRKSRSTTHALIAIPHTWMTALDSHGSVRSVFVDFRKAFDLVDHNQG